MDGSELKARAREQLKPVFWIMIGCALVLSIIFYLIDNEKNPLVYFVFLFVYCPLLMGFNWMTLDLADGKEVKFAQLVDGFNDYGRVIVFEIINTILLVGWTLLFFIPGIIKMYSYIMAPYIMKDNPEMSGLDAISESRAMMAGHKADLFFIHLSFFGWIILSIVTFGIVGLYTTPYTSVTDANFYRMLKSREEIVHIEL